MEAQTCAAREGRPLVLAPVPVTALQERLIMRNVKGPVREGAWAVPLVLL